MDVTVEDIPEAEVAEGGGGGEGVDRSAALADIAESLGFNDRPDQETDSEVPDDESNSASESTESTSPEPKEKLPDGESGARAGAPPTWRPGAAAEWEKVPQVVKEEILKREQDIFSGLEAYKENAGIGHSFRQVASPYMNELQAMGTNPVEHMKALFHADSILRKAEPEARAEMFRQIASSYGVNFGGNEAEEVSFEDPSVKVLRTELAELKSHMRQQTETATQHKQQELLAEIDRFAKDPENMYFDQVANDIAAYLTAGVAKDLKDAYERAVWANPTTRAAEQSRLATESQKQAEKARAEKVAKAKTAQASNVKSRIGKPRDDTASAEGDIDTTLEKKLAEIRSRSN